MNPVNQASGAAVEVIAAGPMDHADLIDGRGALRDALSTWITEAARRGASELWWCDQDLALWPVGERAWIAALDRWAATGRRLIVLVADDAPLQRLHPRWLAWRRTWSHLVELRLLDTETARPSRGGWAFSPGQPAVEILDASLGRARWVREAPALQAAGQLLGGWRERSAPGMPVKALGL